MSKTITRQNLADAVYHEVGLSRRAAADLVDSVLEEVTQSLAQTGEVKLSSFGNFTVRAKAERIGRNPKTGEEVPIAPRKVISFRPSHILKDKVNR